MKNKYFVGVIIVLTSFTVIIIFLNLFDSDSKQTFFFERNFDNKNLLNFNTKYEKNNKSEYIMHVPSDNLIVERDKVVLNSETAEYEINFSDLKFNNKRSKTVILPNYCNLLYCDPQL